ncbi:MAG: hypothetical protein LAT64_02145 [Phycisphaerales bacterium]|nr:hypothetical protein [Planctomycetota bacterium]MCH8507559.1 hypothetical protein [Phycisphaerales bacterium]
MTSTDTDNKIFAIDGLEIFMYDSIEQMCADIEPYFLLSGDYTLYAANGSRISVQGTVEAGGKFESTPPNPESTNALRSSLIEHLIYCGNVDSDSGQTLEELVGMFPTDNRRTNAVRQSPRTFIFITITLLIGLALTILILRTTGTTPQGNP